MIEDIICAIVVMAAGNAWARLTDRARDELCLVSLWLHFTSEQRAIMARNWYPWMERGEA